MRGRTFAFSFELPASKDIRLADRLRALHLTGFRTSGLKKANQNRYLPVVSFIGVPKCSVSPHPSIAPARDLTVHIVLNDFGRLGRAYHETDEARCDRQSVIDDLLGGQFDRPIRVIAFNAAEGWSRDVSEDIARAVAEKAQGKADVAVTRQRRVFRAPYGRGTFRANCWRTEMARKAAGGFVRLLAGTLTGARKDRFRPSSSPRSRPRVRSRRPARSGNTRSSSMATGCSFISAATP